MKAKMLVAALLLAAVPRARANGPDPVRAAAPDRSADESQTPSAPSPAAPGDDQDLDLDPAEPDFTVIALPTNLRVPRNKLAFRLTHRFTRPLGQGDFSDLLGDFFGMDGGAQIGFGLRFGLLRGTQVGVYRTSDRTIQFQAQQEVLRAGDHPLGLSVLASVEGLDNFGEEYSPAVGLVLSRRLGARGAVYAVPTWVGNTRVVLSAPGDEDSTFVLGLGARVRVGGTLALVGEIHPRLAGYKGNLGSGDPDPLATFGVEWQVGGHAFQINFSNDLGTTPAQLARGAQGPEGWYIGFNLTRKFF
jgi:hypothetical protein